MQMPLRRVSRVMMPLLIGTSAVAQSAEIPHGLPICPPGSAPIVDSAEYSVVISPGTAWNRHEYSESERQRISYHADAIRQRFVPPATLGSVPVIGERNLRSWGGAPSAHSAVSGKFVLVIKPNGRLKTTFWQVLPFSTTCAAALQVAVIAADTALEFQAMPLRETGSGEDTLVVQLRSLVGMSEATDMPLMRVRLARFVLDAGPAVVRYGAYQYPPSAWREYIDNRGEVQVFVGSNGRAVMAATQITRSEWRVFLRAMQQAVRGNVYAPARSGGCAVPALTVQPFVFTRARQ